MTVSREECRTNRTSPFVVVLIGVVLATVQARAQSPFAPGVAARTPTATPSPVPPGEVEIEVVLLSGKKRLMGDDSVAWVPKLTARGRVDTHVKIAQKKKQFEPRIAVVSVGSKVEFPNFDRVFHNVFSLSTPHPFDLGLYRKGKSKSVRFDQPGLVQIYCNIHPHMVAYLMIVDSRRHATADARGRIRLRNIPPGMTTIEGWNVRGGMWSRDVRVRSGRQSNITVELDVSSWRDVPHLNKHGKEYPPPDDDDFRY